MFLGCSVDVSVHPVLLGICPCAPVSQTLLAQHLEKYWRNFHHTYSISAVHFGMQMKVSDVGVKRSKIKVMVE